MAGAFSFGDVILQLLQNEDRLQLDSRREANQEKYQSGELALRRSQQELSERESKARLEEQQRQNPTIKLRDIIPPSAAKGMGFTDKQLDAEMPLSRAIQESDMAQKMQEMRYRTDAMKEWHEYMADMRVKAAEIAKSMNPKTAELEAEKGYNKGLMSLLTGAGSSPAGGQLTEPRGIFNRTVGTFLNQIMSTPPIPGMPGSEAMSFVQGLSNLGPSGDEITQQKNLNAVLPGVNSNLNIAKSLIGLSKTTGIINPNTTMAAQQVMVSLQNHLDNIQKYGIQVPDSVLKEITDTQAQMSQLAGMGHAKSAEQQNDMLQRQEALSQFNYLLKQGQIPPP